MTAFTVIWFGQLFSSAATRMINFALAIWVWQETNRAGDLALMTLLAFGATVVVSPAAGALVDRWSRRRSIVLTDLGSAAAAATVLVLFATHSASLLPLLAVNTLSGAFLAFQYPAYSTLVTSLLSKKQYARANGMISMVRSLPAIFAPGLAGVLMSLWGIEIVILIALLSYVVAIITMFLVAMPPTPASGGAESSFWHDSMFGFRYILRTPGLAGYQAISAVVGLASAMGFIALTPLVLLQTGNDEAQLGAVNSIGAIGGVLGALAVSMVKAPARKMPWIFAAIALFSAVGRTLLGVSGDFVYWALAWFVSWLAVPVMEAYGLAIWQQKTPPAVQGRVFSAVQFIGQFALMVGFAATGPLVDHFLQPAMAREGWMASMFGPVVGTGPSAGMRLVFLASATMGLLALLYGLASRRVRQLEILIPDHDDDPNPERQPSA